MLFFTEFLLPVTSIFTMGSKMSKHISWSINSIHPPRESEKGPNAVVNERRPLCSIHFEIYHSATFTLFLSPRIGIHYSATFTLLFCTLVRFTTEPFLPYHCTLERFTTVPLLPYFLDPFMKIY